MTKPYCKAAFVHFSYRHAHNCCIYMNLPFYSVIREQYWACSKWPHAQRILAVAVGLLLGAVIGLAITLVINAINPDANISTFFDS